MNFVDNVDILLRSYRNVMRSAEEYSDMVTVQFEMGSHGSISGKRQPHLRTQDYFRYCNLLRAWLSPLLKMSP